MNAPVKRYRTTGLPLDSGTVLEEEVHQAYTLQGELSADRDNLVLLFHSLTSGPDPGHWWPQLVGPGRPIDTERFAVLCPNLLGSCYGTSRPGAAVTPRDMARLVRRLVAELGVERVALATGGSLGGMVALEWAATYPALTRAALVFAAPAAHTAQAIGFNHLQRSALELGGGEGLALARMAAMLTYRTAGEFDRRFGRERRADGRFQVQSYLDHHGAKLVERFDPEAYRRLLDAMDAHDVGRARGGIGPALRPFQGHLVGVGITGDLLYEPETVQRWTDAVGARYAELRSIHGHDAFLLETAQVGALLTDVLERTHSIPQPTGPGECLAHD